MPVVVHAIQNKNTLKKLASNKYLLDKIEHELKACPIKFQYAILENKQLTDSVLKDIKFFLDLNYSGIIYPFELFKFLVCDSLVLKIFNSDAVMGYIVAKKKMYRIFDENMPAMDINFFCMAKQFRHKHLGSYVINILIRECITRYDISIALYTIKTKLRVPPYANKKLYHRPINLKILNDHDFLDKNENYDRFLSFDKGKHRLEHYNGSSPSSNELLEISSRLKIFNDKHFKMSEIHNLKETMTLFITRSFHNFVFFNESRKIVDYLCIVVVPMNGYKMSYIHSLFLKDYSLSNIRCLIESVCEYCKINHIVDVFSFYDMFPTDDYNNDLMCLEGISNTNYFMFNYSMFKIKNSENCILHL